MLVLAEPDDTGSLAITPLPMRICGRFGSYLAMVIWGVNLVRDTQPLRSLLPQILSPDPTGLV